MSLNFVSYDQNESCPNVDPVFNSIDMWGLYTFENNVLYLLC